MTIGARKPGTERREEIVRAVLKIIGERGFPSLTTTTLAEEIGLTSGALFRHFDSRDDILREVVRAAVLRVEDTFPEASLPPAERLLQLARNRIQLLGSDPGLAWLLRSEQAYMALPEDAVRRLRDLVQRSKQYLLDAIREGGSLGEFRSDIEPEILLVLVMSTIQGLAGMPGVHRLAAGEQRPDPERVLSALETLLAVPRGAGVGNKQARQTRKGPAFEKE